MACARKASSLRSFSRQAIMTPSWRRLLLPSAGAVKMLAWPDGRVRATAALEDAEQDYAEAMGRLGMGGLGPSGVEEAGGTGDGPMGGYGWPGFRYWLVAGLAFTLPLVVLGLLALALGLLR